LLKFAERTERVRIW